MAMPRFFFHIVNDTSSTPDEEGQELANREAAWAEARRTIGAVIADEVTAGRNLVHLAIQITDEAGISLADVRAIANVVFAEKPPIRSTH